MTVEIILKNGLIIMDYTVDNIFKIKREIENKKFLLTQHHIINVDDIVSIETR